MSDRFPPSFDDNPFTYALALFSLSLVSAISLTIVIGWLLEPRRRREIDRLIGNQVPMPLPVHMVGSIPAVRLYRLIVGLLLTTIICGALPDVLILLAWGEAGHVTLDTLFTIDRLADGLVIVPFLSAMYLALRAAQVTEHRLSLQPVMVALRPGWSVVREKARLVGLLLLIAGAVTMAKANPDAWIIR